MRRLATWTAVGFVGALGVAAAVAALVGGGDDSSRQSEPSTSQPTTTEPAECRPEQLALLVRHLGDTPTVVLRHVSGPPCDVGTLRISLSVRDRDGSPVPIQQTREAFTGVIQPGLEFIGGLTYLPGCDQKGPLVADVRAGGLTATSTLPISGCLDSTTLPRCRRGQLALSLEPVGGQSAAVLRHVRGGTCRLGHLKLRVFITDRHGSRERIRLGSGEQANIGGEYSSGVERIVPFSVCYEGAPFVAEARAGSYVARGPALVGGQNCYSAVRQRIFDFGVDPDVRTTTVEALDVSVHPLTVRIDLPRGTQIDVWIQQERGRPLELFSHGEHRGCTARGDRERCVLRFGLLEGSSAGVWTAFVRKRSSGPARVRISFAFEPPSAGTP